MVDKLGSLSQVMLRLQQQQAKKAAAPQAGKTGRGTVRPASPEAMIDGDSRPAPLEVTPSRASWEERVLKRLANLDPEDPKRRQRALKALVEIRLLNTFGEQLVNDAGFQQLVEDVSNAMQADSALQQDIEEATALLLRKG